MTTAAETQLNELLFGASMGLLQGYTIDFSPVFVIEQEIGEARNFGLLGDLESLVLNDGIVRDFISGRGTADVIISNTGTIGSSGRAETVIQVTGTGQRLIVNDGDINGNIQLGGGADYILNTGLINGDIRMGGGDDIFVQTSTGTAVERVIMGSGDDVVVNTGAMGKVFLGSGDDLYIAQNSNATTDGIRGGTGNDTVRGGTADDVISGGDGQDLLQGNDGNDRIFGNDGADNIQGGVGDDFLHAGRGSDLLVGGSGRDRLVGDSGQDRLIGGNDNDTLSGGSGDDVFIFGRGAGQDVITDFRDGDLIVLASSFVPAVPGAVEVLDVDTLIDSVTTYTGGNAFVNLDALYVAIGMSDLSAGRINSLRLNNVEENSLTADDFIL